MTEHIWSVLCHRAYVDKVSNRVSLMEVIEKLEVRAAREDFEQQLAAGANMLPVQFEVLTWWLRTEPATPEKVVSRISVRYPNGDLALGQEVALNLEGEANFRQRAIFPGFPIKGFGRYWFEIEFRDSGDADWKIAARLPVDLVLREPQPPAAATP